MEPPEEGADGEGLEIKEAEVPDFDYLRAFEAVLLDDKEPFFCRVAMAWLCCLTWAALRGDDFSWVIPASMELFEHFLGAITKRAKTIAKMFEPSEQSSTRR